MGMIKTLFSQFRAKSSYDVTATTITPLPKSGPVIAPSGRSNLSPAELERAVNPVGSPYSPNPPLPPIMPPGTEPMSYPPMVGYNLVYSSNKKPGASFAQLRALADNCVPLRVCIEDLKCKIRSARTDLGPSDEAESRKKTRKGTPPAEVAAFCERPDGDALYGDWVGSTVEDLLVTGAYAWGKLKTVAGKPSGLRVIDAATIVPIVNSLGQVVKAPAPGYYQYAYGLPFRWYTTDDLFYRPYSRRSWSPFGFSPVEQALQVALLAINRNMYYLQWFSGGTQPPAWMKMPDNFSDEKIKAWETYLNGYMGGNTEQRHKVKGIPEAFNPVETSAKLDWAYELDEYLYRVFAWLIGVPATPIIKQSSLGKGSEGMDSNAQTSGLIPLQQFFEEGINAYIHNDLGQPGWSLRYVSETDQNGGKKLEEDTQFVDKGIRTRNEVRIERGWEPLPGEIFDKPCITTASGVVEVKEPEPVPEALAQGADVQGAPTGVPPQKPGDKGAQEVGKPLEFPVPKEKVADAKADLGRWRKIHAKAMREGKRSKAFASEALPSELVEFVQKAIDAGAAEPFSGVSLVGALGAKQRPKFADFRTDPDAHKSIATGAEVVGAAYARMAMAVRDDLLDAARARIEARGE